MEKRSDRIINHSMAIMGMILCLLFVLACKPFHKIGFVKNDQVSVTSVFPNYVNANGGDIIELAGVALHKIKSIKINGQNCSSITKFSSSKISCILPSNGGVAELADLTLLTEQGTFVLKDAITYTLIIGQADSASSGYFDRILSTPIVAKVMAQKLFVTDLSNHRILIWNSVPTSYNVSPDLILGQSSGRSFLQNYPTISGSTFSSPMGVWTDGTKLAVADNANHRVLLWNSFPSKNGQVADVVLGQPDFTSNTMNNAPATAECGGVGGLNSCSIRSPFDVLFAENKLIVAEEGSARLLIWDGWPSTKQEPADYVIGQPDFFTNTANNGPNTIGCGAAGRNACSLSSPRFMSYYGGKLLVSDVANHRILIFNSIPLSYGTPADLVLGQADFVSASISGPATAPCGGVAGVNACSLKSPSSVTTDGTYVYVSDLGNNRVLGWTSFPATNQQPADIVIGQDSMLQFSANKGASAPSASSLSAPYYVNIHDSKLWVLDRSNNRVLKFDPLPSSFASANMLLGHGNFYDSMPNTYNTFSDKLQNPTEAIFDGSHTLIADRMNNRVIIETALPISMSNTVNRITLGQPDVSKGIINNGPNTVACGGVAGLNACSLSQPMGVLKVGNKVVISDFGNNRILIWNNFPTTDQEPADLVLGQPSFTTSTQNNGPNTVACGNVLGRNKCSLYNPIGLASDGTNLVVSDFGNHRILIWNTFPTVNQQPADTVLGQPDFTTGTINNGPNSASCDNSPGINRCSLYSPFFMKIFNNKLIVADEFNHRVLIWNSIPSTNQAPADVVIGHSAFTDLTATKPPTGRTLDYPRGLCVTDSGRLVIGDTANNRALVFNQIPSSNNAKADMIIGQDDEFGFSMDGGRTTRAGNFYYIYGVSCYREKIMFSDYYNHRIQYLPLRSN